MNSLKAAQAFAKKTVAKGKKSKLDPHFDAIKFLLENDYSLLQIQDFLKNEIKLSVSYSNLQGWVKRRFKNESSDQKIHYDQGSNEVPPVTTGLSTPAGSEETEIEAVSLAVAAPVEVTNNKKRGKRYTSSPDTIERRANYSLESNNSKDEK
jgi:hypothetical protein